MSPRIALTAVLLAGGARAATAADELVDIGSARVVQKVDNVPAVDWRQQRAELRAMRRDESPARATGDDRRTLHQASSELRSERRELRRDVRR